MEAADSARRGDSTVVDSCYCRSFVITGAKTLVIKGSMTGDHVTPFAIKHSTLGDSLEAADSAIVVVHVVIM